jgi:hypothetical protein
MGWRGALKHHTLCDLKEPTEDMHFLKLHRVNMEWNKFKLKLPKGVR